MIRTAAISPEHRANLRHLRATFEAAFDAIDDLSDRSGPEYVEADRCYRVWVRAIDEVAIALLDDIDSLEATAKDGGSRPADVAPRTQAVPETPDLADMFSGALEFERTRELVGTTDADVQEERLYEEP